MSHISDPFRFALAIAPDDNTVLTRTTGLYIGGTGNVTVRMAVEGNIVTFTNVPVGILSVQCDKVMATGTTATGIVAGW